MEVLHDGRVTCASDVYSFGMIMLEMFTGVPVFEGYSSSQVSSLGSSMPVTPRKRTAEPRCCSQGAPASMLASVLSMTCPDVHILCQVLNRRLRWPASQPEIVKSGLTQPC